MADIVGNFNQPRPMSGDVTEAPVNPFSNRAAALSGPATDALPVTPDDSTDLPHVAVGLYVETGGTILIDTVKCETRTLMVANFATTLPLPLGVRRVYAIGTMDILRVQLVDDRT